MYMESNLSEKDKKSTIPLYLKIIFLVLLSVLITEGFLFLNFNNKQTFSVKNNGYNLAINQDVAENVLSKLTLGQTPRGRFFVWDTKTWHDNVNRVEIEFTDIPQPYGVVVESSDPDAVLSSFNNKYKNNKLLLKVQVADSLVKQDPSNLINIYTDAIMRAFYLSKNPDYIQDGDYQKNLNTLVKNQIESGQPLLINADKNFIDEVLEQLKDLISFLKPGSFVVKAAGCYGTYECGISKTTIKILGGYTDEGLLLGSCTVCNTICRTFGTCLCQTTPWCDGGGSAPQPCGGDASSCTGARCGTSGSCTYDNSCWWDSSGGGTTPTPTPAPTTPPTSNITMQVVVGLDKNRNGIFDDGYYQVIEDPVDTNCGTFPNISGLTVSYSGAATGSINYHTGCVGGTYNYPYSTKAIAATGDFTFTLNNLPSNYSLKWIESNASCTLSGGVVTCKGLANGQTYGLWFFIQESGVSNCKNLTGPSSLYVGETGTFTATSVAS